MSSMAKTSAKTGEVVILYATGLGQHGRDGGGSDSDSAAAWVEKAADFQGSHRTVNQLILRTFLYVECAPRALRVYTRLILRLPDNIGRNPE